MNISFSTVNSLSKADAAQWYAKQGIRVFPCVPGGKEPAVRWTEEATTDPWTIELWWLKWPNSNIGLAMGGKDGWVALDLDQGTGKDGWASYQAAGGPLVHPWPEQTTPNGGLHLLWRCGWLAQEFSNFARRGSAGGVDMRVDRGYIVAAPSVVEGRSYQWADGNPDAPVTGDLLAACLDWSTHREALDIDVPLAADLGEAELAGMVTWLEERREEGTGDQSRDAYLAFKVAFQVLGWDLSVAAAVLPESWVGEFGAAPPHGAGNPVAWAWKYVVLAAWRDSGRQKEGPVFTPVGGPVGGVNTGPDQEESHQRTGVDGGGGTKFPAAQVTKESAAAVDTSYSAHLSACAQLPPNDYPAMAAMVERVVACALPESQQLALWKEVKRFSEYPIGVVKAVAKEAADKQRRLAEEARERAVQGKVASPLTPLYVMAQDRVLLPASGALVSRPAFLTEKAREHEGQRDVAEQVWLTGEKARCPVVSDITYHPGLPSGVVTDRRGVTLYNTYKPTELVPRGDGSAESVRPWLDLLDSLALEEGERGKAWLLDRLAAAVQYPGRKVNHGILMGGKPGIGKDSFLAPWLDSVGRGNVNIVDGSEMASGFNSWAAGCKVAVVNEIDWGDHKDRRLVQEKLKRVLAAPPETLTINEKNLRPYDIPNLLQVVGFTNHRQCLSVDQGERRYLALWCRLEVPPSGEVSRAWGDWFASYWGWLKQGGSAAVLAYLRARVINIDEVAGGRPPVTAWLEELMESSADGLAVWLRDAADARVGPFIADVVTPKILLDWIATGAGGYHIEGYVGRRRLDRAMHYVGWNRNQRNSYRRGDGGIEWSRPGVVRADPAMDHAEARKTARILQMDARQRKDLARRGKLPEQAFQMLYGDAPRPGDPVVPDWV
jgi:hypothetical protein